MAKGKSIPEKRKSDAGPVSARHYNLNYCDTLKESESLRQTHIKLRELFGEYMTDWQKEIDKKVELTTNIEEFINLNLSVCGLNIKDGYPAGYESNGLGISVYHLKGYDSAIAGNNPYMDEIEVPGLGVSDEMISQNLYDFMEGYLWSMRDSYITGRTKVNSKKDEELTKRAHILQLYYEKGCLDLQPYHVEQLALDKGFTKAVFINTWKNLKKNNYRHNGQINNVQAYKESYEALMKIFKNNSAPFNAVKNHYDQLKETYPDLSY